MAYTQTHLDALQEALASGSPVGARHDQGSSKASISKGKRERGGREAVDTGAGLSYGVTERYGAGY